MPVPWLSMTQATSTFLLCFWLPLLGPPYQPSHGAFPLSGKFSAPSSGSEFSLIIRSLHMRKLRKALEDVPGRDQHPYTVSTLPPFLFHSPYLVPR